MTSLAPRARAAVRARSRTALARSVGLLHPVRRALAYPVDRSRAPAGPAAVVVEPDLSPRALRAQGHQPLFAADVRRYASCTGAVWTRPDRLVTGHLLARTLVTYDFDGSGPRPRVRRRSTVAGRGGLGQVTNLTVSPDGAWLAVADSVHEDCGIFPIDPATGDPVPEVAARVGVPGDHNMHAVEFSPDGRFLSFTGIDATAGIRTVAFAGDPESRTCTFGAPTILPSDDAPPKGLSFSPDGRFLAVGSGQNASRDARHLHAAASVVVRAHDPVTGVVGDVVSRLTGSVGLLTVEDVTWFPDGERLAVTDQAGDAVFVVRVDPGTGRLGDLDARIGWAAGGLRLPHGCAVSPDGRWLAVTNYGDGSVRLYRLGS